MKKALVFIAVLVMFFLFTNSSPAQNENDQLTLEGLRSVVESRGEAWNTGDVSTIMALERDLVEFRSHGKKPTHKRDFSDQEFQQYLQNWFAERPSVGFTVKDYDLEVIGNTGLVWGVFEGKGIRKDGTAISNEVRFTQTWIFTDGKWRMVLAHRSLMPK